MDVRDLICDLTHRDTPLSQTALDTLAFLPVLGDIKYLRKGAGAAEDIATGLKAAGQTADSWTHAARDLGRAAEAGAGENALTAYRKTADDLAQAAKDSDGWEDAARSALRDADKTAGELVTEGAGDIFKSTPELENHIQHIDTSVPRNRGIGGAHNSKEFFKNDVKIVKAVPSEDIPGVTYYQYNIPKLGKDGWPVGEYGTKIFEKTIYDPSVISDSEYTQRGLEAASNSYKTNGLLGSVWEGYDSQGVKWIGYGKNGKPTSFFPDVPKP